ncbi:MAG: T9SS type A sorting domain-containing protein [Bacteroidetes bacterium]|nr:T9SS type A sorting domain-containing protein [Bacteroidota bacterium]
MDNFKTSNGITYSGDFDKSGYFLLTVSDDSYTGYFNINNEDYFSLEPIEKGIHILQKQYPSTVLQLDESKDTFFDETEVSDPLRLPQPQGDDSPEMSILFFYTTAAAQAHGNINSLLNNCIGDAKVLYAWSNILVRPYWAGHLELTSSQFTETGNLVTDWYAFRDNSFVQSMRTQYEADICVHIVSSSTDGNAGVAMYTGPTNPRNACLVVRQDRAVHADYHSFVHELGHVQGMNHQYTNDNPSACYCYHTSYAPFYKHGYHSASWRTIMATLCPDKHYVTFKPRIPYFSDPTKTYNGTIRGDATYSNCVLGINSRMSIFCNYYTSSTSTQKLNKQSYGFKDNFEEPNENILKIYPNPFNPTTQINFILASPNNVNVAIYDNLGQKLKTLIDNDLSSGKHTATLNGNDLSSGIYYCILQIGDKQYIQKIVMLK